MQVHPDRIGRHTLNILTDDHNELFLSSASSIEIAQKFRQGTLRLPEPPDEYVPDRMLATGVHGLSIEHSHSLELARFDQRKHDLVDLILVSQARIENLPIISSDRKLASFDIEFIDALT